MDFSKITKSPKNNYTVSVEELVERIVEFFNLDDMNDYEVNNDDILFYGYANDFEHAVDINYDRINQRISIYYFEREDPDDHDSDFDFGGPVRDSSHSINELLDYTPQQMTFRGEYV